jgi:thioredoxin 1
MKKLLPFVFLLLSCSSQKLALAPADFEQKLNTPNGNFQLIDLRKPEVYDAGHIKNASNIPAETSDFEKSLLKLDKSKPVLIYSQSDCDATTLKKIHKSGFKTYALKGGIDAWENAGKPIVETPKLKPVGLTMDGFQKIINTNPVVLFDFGATWCGPCRMLAPIVNEVANEKKSQLLVINVDIDQNRELSQQLYIFNIPFLILYKNGKRVWNGEGYMEKQTLVEAIEKNY